MDHHNDTLALTCSSNHDLCPKLRANTTPRDRKAKVRNTMYTYWCASTRHLPFFRGQRMASEGSVHAPSNPNGRFR